MKTERKGWRGTIRGRLVCGPVALLAMLLSMIANPRLGAVDFIRGDINGDGVVSIADSYLLLHVIAVDGLNPVLTRCYDAADFNNSDQVDFTDAIQILQFAAMDGSPPPAPFPQAGPDTEPSGRLPPCNAYGGGVPLQDPAAELSVEGFATGGSDGHATITVKLSNSHPVSAYYGKVRDGAGILTDFDSVHSGLLMKDLSGTIGGELIVMPAALQDGRLSFVYVNTGACKRDIQGNEDCSLGPIPTSRIAPGEDRAVLEFTICLKPGTLAGEYPLELEAGELVDADSGRSITPALMSSTLNVHTYVRDVDCRNTASDPAPINVIFLLPDSSGVPGGTVTVPFSILSSVESQGFAFSIDFDEEVLQAQAIEKLWQRPGGTPYDFQKFEFSNENNTPGNAGVDEGFLAGAAIISLTDTGAVIPRGEEAEVLKLHLRVKEDAPLGSTQLRFLDGAQLSGDPVPNMLISAGRDITPDVADSFVFINSLIGIVGDVSTFIRGDSNGDGIVDISDPKRTLSYLYLGGEAPACYDAADADDDGVLDISDPIRTLQFLFLGGPPLPGPSKPGGQDPTPDDPLGCLIRR